MATNKITQSNRISERGGSKPFTAAAKRKHLAEQIVAYLAVRAAHEGVEMHLTADWIEGGLHHGCRGFFGIEVSDTRILRDRQEPEPGFLATWQRRVLN